jgi:hypothetical protein
MRKLIGNDARGLFDCTTKLATNPKRIEEKMN